MGVNILFGFSTESARDKDRRTEMLNKDGDNGNSRCGHGPEGGCCGAHAPDMDRILSEMGSLKSELDSLIERSALEIKEANSRFLAEMTERKKAEFELKKLGAALEHSTSIVFISGKRAEIEYVNSSFELSTGFSKAEALGKTPGELFSEAGSWGDMLAREGWQGTLKSLKKDGTPLWCKGVVSPIKEETGEITHYLSVFEDVTEKKASHERINYLSNHDAVTGLLNRAYFIESLADWIEENPGPGALFLLDIDQFKFISDSYGHGMGDEFLMRIARLIQFNMRHIIPRHVGASGDCMVARLSGDEFAIFAPVGRVEAVQIAEHIRKGLECFYQADFPCHLTASIGVALFPEHGETTSELLTRADAAMYRAKEQGRNRFHFYSPEEREIEQMHMRLKCKEGILDALEEDRFEPWFQPIMRLSENSVSHYEVLARMREKDGSIVLPGPFIETAERFGLVGAISRVIIGKALDLQAKLRQAGRDVTFCMNVSGKELGDREFLYFLKGRILELGMDPGSVVFEITETASIYDLDRAISFINGLREIGCRISLDDFGIGFTSFLYLREMQVDYIKIAGSFIKGLEMNLNDQLFVKAITDVARGMKIETIAEFVESSAILGSLRKYGIDYAQGYFVGKPAPTPEFHSAQKASGL